RQAHRSHACPCFVMWLPPLPVVASMTPPQSTSITPAQSKEADLPIDMAPCSRPRSALQPDACTAPIPNRLRTIPEPRWSPLADPASIRARLHAGIDSDQDRHGAVARQ